MGVDPSWTDVAGVAILGVQLLILVMAAIVAWRQVSEARRLREQQIRPFVVVDFDVDDFLFMLTVGNIGTTIARNVTIRITPPLTSSIESPDAKISDLKMLRDSIATLAPGKTIRTLFDSAIQRNPEGFPDVYEAVIEYDDDEGRRHFKETATLDLGIYWNLQRISRQSIHDVHKRLEEIAATLKGWSATGGGLLRMSPEEERERADAALEARRQQRESRQRPGSDG